MVPSAFQHIGVAAKLLKNSMDPILFCSCTVVDAALVVVVVAVVLPVATIDLALVFTSSSGSEESLDFFRLTWR